jgi:hypothetical protein
VMSGPLFYSTNFFPKNNTKLQKLSNRQINFKTN